MGRPQCKTDLIEAANNNYAKLLQLVSNMSEIQRTTAFDFTEDVKKKEAHWRRDKNIRDIYIHLYEWHQLLLNWVNNNLAGNKQPFLPEPYNWKTYGEMNIEFFNKHQNTEFETSKTMLEKSHGEVMTLIDGFTNEELFTKKVYTWTGTTTLGSYCVSATASHYDWAMKKIRAHKKKVSQDKIYMFFKNILTCL